MTEEVHRNYLEINSIQDLNKVIEPEEDYSLNLLDPINFQLNKFFYKTIGKNFIYNDVHFNGNGYKIIADRISAYLNK